MLILDDKMLQQTGLDYVAARALLAPPDGELCIHIVRCLDDDGYVEDDIEEAPGYTTENDDDGRDVRRAVEGEPAASSAVPTIPPTDDIATRAAVEAAAAIGYRPPVGTAHPMPEDLGLTFSGVEQQARDRRMTLVQNSPGVYTLISAFGMRHYASLAQVASAMRHNRY